MSSILTPRSYIENRQLASTSDASSTASSADASQTVSSNTTGFFGPDGPSFRDVLDAINPLNHIPIVSGIFQQAVGHTPSVGSQLLGGAIFGPIGFASSLANVIFEQQTGKDVGGSMVAALGGSTPSAVQVAANTKNAATDEEQVASADTKVPEVEEGEQLASIDPKQMNLSSQLAAQASASSGSSQNDSASSDEQKNKAIMALYGASSSANRAYQKAQFLPYLKDATATQVM